MAIAQQDIDEVFRRYGSALAAGDPAKMAKLWGHPAYILSDEQSLAVTSKDESVAFFEKWMATFEGVSRVEAAVQDIRSLSDKVALCDVRWDHMDADGKTVGKEAGHYLVKGDGDGVRIYVYTPASQSWQNAD